MFAKSKHLKLLKRTDKQLEQLKLPQYQHILNFCFATPCQLTRHNTQWHRSYHLECLERNPYAFVGVPVCFMCFYTLHPPSSAAPLESTPGLGLDPGLDSSALAWVGDQTIAKWAIWRLPYGGTDRQANQWDQESWPRCCWDGQRCLCQWSTWPVVKPGKDRIRLAASPAPWTRGRCSGFDAVARRRWEGKGGDVCLCRCHSFLALFDCGSILTNCAEEKNSEFAFACRTH